VETTLHNPAISIGTSRPGIVKAIYWIVTAIFCLEMSFTAYAEMRVPQVADEFARLGFSAAFFRAELTWAKVIGVILLVAPVPARLKEWAYVGFAINLASALIAHFAVGEGVAAWEWAAGASVLWGISYFLWLRLKRS
jgi:hypothetical protein